MMAMYMNALFLFAAILLLDSFVNVLISLHSDVAKGNLVVAKDGWPIFVWLKTIV